LNELRPWRRLQGLETSVDEKRQSEHELKNELDSANSNLRSAADGARSGRTAVSEAEGSFFIGRKRRLESAHADMRSALRRLEEAEARVSESQIAWAQAQAETVKAEGELRSSQDLIYGLRPVSELERLAAALASRKESLQHQIDRLEPDLDGAANELLDSARALFATLTKLYVDRRLNEREWDVLVVDEVSMAMLPLVAFAATRAKKRVVLVGDFYQLPPIVQSRRPRLPALRRAVHEPPRVEVEHPCEGPAHNSSSDSHKNGPARQGVRPPYRLDASRRVRSHSSGCVRL